MKFLRNSGFASAMLAGALLGVVAPAAIAAEGGKLLKTFAQSESNAQSTTQPAFVDLPNASVTVIVPAGKTRLIKARFSGESACYGSSSYCSVRILADGPGPAVELNPVVGGDFAFDSTDGATETSGSWEAHSIDRHKRLSAGTYVIYAQWGTVGAGGFFRLDDWSFNVDVIE